MPEKDMYFQQGCEMLEEGKYDEAEGIFKKIVDVNPEHYEAINKLGVILARRGELEDAMGLFKSSLDINSDYGPVLVNIGNIFCECGDYEIAEKYYLTSIETNPDYGMAYYNLGVLYRKKGQYSKYIKNYKQYQRIEGRELNNPGVASVPGLSKRSRAGIVIFILCLFIIITFTSI